MLESGWHLLGLFLILLEHALTQTARGKSKKEYGNMDKMTSLHRLIKVLLNYDALF